MQTHGDYANCYLSFWDLIFVLMFGWAQTIEGIPNATAIELDVTDHDSLSKCISQVFKTFINGDYMFLLVI